MLIGKLCVHMNGAHRSSWYSLASVTKSSQMAKKKKKKNPAGGKTGVEKRRWNGVGNYARCA